MLMAAAVSAKVDVIWASHHAALLWPLHDQQWAVQIAEMYQQQASQQKRKGPAKDDEDD